MSNKTAERGLPYAETVSYWRSGNSTPDKWITDVNTLITKRGGRVLMSAFGIDPNLDREAYCLRFEFDGDVFCVTWPILPTRRRKPDQELAARRQAATLLFHDVKAKLISAEVLGIRRAFFSHLALPDGRTVVDHATNVSALPQILDPTPRLTSSETAP